jgi:hypothetical protein
MSPRRRAFGFGIALATNHLHREDELKAVLGTPDDVATYAGADLLLQNFDPLTRRPMREVAFDNRSGNPWPD